MTRAAAAEEIKEGKSLVLRHRARKILCAVAGAILALAASASTALAQCAMCRASLGNSTEAPSLSGGMNLAVLVLLIPPVALFCAFFIVAYRLRKAPGEENYSDGAVVELSPRRPRAPRLIHKPAGMKS